MAIAQLKLDVGYEKIVATSSIFFPSRSDPPESIEPATCRDGRHLISRDRMEAIMATLDVLGNPVATKALRECSAGTTKFRRLSG